MIKLLQATGSIVRMSLSLFCQHSRVLLTRNKHAVADFKLFGNGDDLTAAETVLDVLAWDQVGALGNGVDDFAILVVLQTVVETGIAAGGTAAVGHSTRVGKRLPEIRRWAAIQPLTVRPRSIAVKQLVEPRALAYDGVNIRD